LLDSGYKTATRTIPLVCAKMVLQLCCVNSLFVALAALLLCLRCCYW